MKGIEFFDRPPCFVTARAGEAGAGNATTGGSRELHLLFELLEFTPLGRQTNIAFVIAAGLFYMLTETQRSGFIEHGHARLHAIGTEAAGIVIKGRCVDERCKCGFVTGGLPSAMTGEGTDAESARLHADSGECLPRSIDRRKGCDHRGNCGDENATFHVSKVLSSLAHGSR